MKEHFPQHLGYHLDDEKSYHPNPPPLHPLVEEIGGILHQCAPTTSWVNPRTQEVTNYIQVAEPVPVTEACPQHCLEEDWIEFFAHHQQVNQRKEEMETLAEKLSWESHIRDVARINQVHSSGPVKKSMVY